jgi:hypothetical protein
MRATLTTFILLLSLCLHAQEIKWQKEAELVYIYEITSQEALKFLKYSSADSALIKKMLHTPCGSLPGQWKGKSQGHFIFVYIDKDNVNYSYGSTCPFQVFLFQEYGALTLQVVDAQGNLRDDAKVFIRSRGFWKKWIENKIPFNQKSRTYTVYEDTEQKNDLLMVELDGFCAIFDLQRHFASLRYGGYNNYDRTPSFYSYLITDKNKYKPGETVRFKSYALYGNMMQDEGQKPLNNELEIWMQTDPKKRYDYKKIATIPPYHPGGYAGEIVLHDSLQLKLDQEYSFRLLDKNKKIVAATSFKYEDYELYDCRLETHLSAIYHYAPNANEIEIKALDVNGLFLQDVQAEIVVKRGSVLQTFTKLLQMPDTLMYKRIDLENDKPTVAEIPAHIFGEANCWYNVEVRVITYDNQPLFSRESAVFYKSSYDIVAFFQNDTVHFEWQELGKSKEMQAQFWMNEDKEPKMVELPYQIPFNYKDKKYTFRIDSLGYLQSFAVANTNAQLDVEGGFKGDEFNLRLVNPLKLELSWYIYQGSRLLAKGSGTECDTLFLKTNLEQVHYVDFFYLLGGRAQSYRKTFVPKIDFLDVSIDLPDRIYPGQTIEATISVKDIWGKPVPDVDLTAFAYNSPLNYKVPDLTDYGTPPQPREKRTGYTVENKNYWVNVPFNYAYWKPLLCLDTLKLYQFTFPKNKMFTYTVNTPDSTTQVAPYIMKNGKAVNIYVIEINDKPVYFSWTEQPKGYSFLLADTGKQKITLRLHDRAIVLDSLYFEAGKKTIFSIDLDSLPTKNTKVVKLNTRDKEGRYRFTDSEKRTYKSFISQFPVDKNFTCLKQENTIYPIYHSCFQSSRNQILVGPLPEGYMEFCGEIRYRHEGGFSYKFEDNVVYKYSHEVCPEFLCFSSTYNMTTLNDFALTQQRFDQIVENCKKETFWHPRNLQIEQDNIKLNINVPIHPDSIGTSNLLLQNVETYEMLKPNQRLYNYRLLYTTIPTATYHIILLYDDGSFIRYDSVTLKPYTYTKIDMTHLPLYETDSLILTCNVDDFSSVGSVTKNISSNMVNIRSEVIPESKTGRTSGGASTIKGMVKNSNGNAVPYLQLLLKQDGRVINGAYTDDMGAYQIFGVASGKYDISAGGTEICQTIYILTGIYISASEVKFVDLIVDCSNELPEVVVEYVPAVFSQDNTGSSSRLLTGEEIRKTPGRSISAGLADVRGNRSDGQQTIIDGVRIRGAGDVVSSESRSEPQFEVADEEMQDERQAAEERLYYEIMQLNGLRSNFSDVGFWEPRLFTDRSGEAKFTVTFPDNITQWNTIVYAMNRKLQTATLRKKIQSYKPLMAELRNPQFLVAGDTAFYASNIRNYTRDSEIAGQALFIMGEDTISRKEIRFTSSYQDKMQVNPSTTDSLSITYLFQRDDGYTDGEKRTIPVIPRGAEIADGTLQFLKPGDKKTISAGAQEEIYVTLTANPLDIYVNTTSYLRSYRYNCNEQLASKLIGWLKYKMCQQYAEKRFKDDRHIENIIKQLVKNRNENKLWSWFGASSNTNYWMSAHIIRALTMARQAGYTVNLDLTVIEQDYVNTHRYRDYSLRDIDILNALSEAETAQNYEPAIELFDKDIAQKEHQADSIAKANKRKNSTSYLSEKLLLLEIRQRQNIGYAAEKIQKYLKTDALGAVYCDDNMEGKGNHTLLMNTLIAYRIISKDSTLQHLKEAMQIYILRTKQRGWNTYQSASAVMSVLPDLLADSANKKTPSTVLLSGKEQRELTEFPYNITLSSGEQLRVEMKSGLPVIYSDYQLKRVTTEHTGAAFKIETKLNNDNLIAGKQTTLHVTLQVKQANAEYVMIEIPIPAGCSYASKKSNYYRFSNSGYETHREYFKDRVAIFCEKLPIGTYEYEIELLPRYNGNYYLNPAKVEMMYFPVIYSNNDERRVRID